MLCSHAHFRIQVSRVFSDAYHRGYVALKTLVLCIHSAHKSLTRFFGLFTYPRLELVTIHFNEPPLQDFRGLLQALSQHHSLRSLIFLLPPSSSVAALFSASNERFSLADLRPLLSLRMLASFVMKAMPVSCDDGSLRLMAQAWPHLHTFQLLPPSITSEECGHITISGVLHLLKGCPDLRSIHLSVNALILPPVDEIRPGNGVVQSQLESWQVYWSPLDDPFAMASFLSDVAPQVIIKAASGSSSPYKEKWDEVSRLTALLKHIRQQERNFGASMIIPVDNGAVTQ